MSLPLEALLEGKYEILDKIAEGGIGSIYKVRHKLLEEIRVIKVLRSQVADRDDLHQRLLQEAKTAIRLEHPSIARLFDLTLADDGTAYIVMEFIDGVSLDSLLAANGPPSVELTLEIAKQSLHALGYLHESGFIHRDISPDNLMLTRDSSDRVRVKLIDLGIAKDLAQETGVTAVGTFLGKVKYCAPELFKEAGAKQLDQRSDNYSLAVTLYELLTGRHPFTGETFEELAAGHLFHPPTAFDESDPDGRVPEALREIILRALAKNPDDRPSNAAEFAKALEPFEIDEDQLAVELEQTIGATTRFLSKFERYSSGSTQDHLNEQFLLEKTGVAKPSVADREAEPAAPVAGKTTKTEAVLTVVPGKATARDRNWAPSKVLAALAIAVPLIAGATWMALRPPPPPGRGMPPPPGRRDGSPPLIPPERFNPDAASSVITAPDMPSELLEEEDAAAETTAGEMAATPVQSEQAPVEASDSTPPPPEAAPAQADPNRTIALLKAGPGVVAPQLVEPLEPAYPRPDRNEVLVVVSAFVSHEGKVLTATVKDSPSFKRRYREAALAAVQRTIFKPATREGVPGKMWVDVEVRFKP